MQITDDGIRLIKHFEGLFLEAYSDPVGVWTIGWGHTGNIRPGMRISLEEAEDLLRNDLDESARDVRRLVEIDLSDQEFSALVSFVFNLGRGRLASSTLLRKLNGGDSEGAADEFPRWVYGTVNGRREKLPGLVRRRAAERALFLEGTFETPRGRTDISALPSIEDELSDVAGASLDGVGALAAVAGAPIPIALLGQSRALVVDIQSALARYGLLDPPADGIFGPATHWALEEFCLTNGVALGSGFSEAVAAALLAPPRPFAPIAASGTWIDAVIQHMRKRGYWIGRHPAHKNIVYVEGANVDGTLNDNRPNAFNDVRIVFSLGREGVPEYRVWEGTTEPGLFWTVNPMNRNGAARIAFGQYKAWSVGTHHPTRPSRHEALIQVAPIDVYRDLNKDYRREGDTLYRGVFAINQHWGYDAPKNDLGRSSAGCLVGRTKDGHRDFMDLVKQDPRYQANAGYRFITTVLSGAEMGLPPARAPRRPRGGAGRS